MIALAVVIAVGLALVVGVLWGLALERDRAVRFPTVGDRLAVARATKRKRRAWSAERYDLNPALRRRSP